MKEERPQSLKVPFGLSPEGEEVHARIAERSTQYHCPSCNAELVLKRGKIQRAHFAHRHEPTSCEFLYETEAHFRAKHRIRELFLAGHEMVLHRRCCECFSRLSQNIQSSSASEVRLEYSLPTGHRADVALLDADENLLAVLEIYSTHYVDNEKASALKADNIQWVELDANSVLESESWFPITDELSKSMCGECKRVQRREELVDKFGRVQPFADEKRLRVTCPIRRGQAVPIFYECAFCKLYEESRSTGIFCIGDSQAGNRKDIP